SAHVGLRFHEQPTTYLLHRLRYSFWHYLPGATTTAWISKSARCWCSANRLHFLHSTRHFVSVGLRFHSLLPGFEDLACAPRPVSRQGTAHGLSGCQGPALESLVIYRLTFLICHWFCSSRPRPGLI